MYKTKYKPNEEIDHFKARLVAKRYIQKPSIGYFEVFIHVTKLCTKICMIISLSTQNNCKMIKKTQIFDFTKSLEKQMVSIVPLNNKLLIFL